MNKIYVHYNVNYYYTMVPHYPPLYEYDILEMDIYEYGYISRKLNKLGYV